MKTALSFTFLFVLLFSLGALNRSQAQDAGLKNWSADVEYAKVFVENKGQFPYMMNAEITKEDGILYAVDQGPVKIYFKKDGVIFNYIKADPKNKKEISTYDEWAESDNKKEGELRPYTQDMVSFSWMNSNPGTELIAEDAVSQYFSYGFTKSGEQKNVNFIKGYKKIIYKNLYPNIDVEYTFHEKEGIKYAIVLHAGADVSDLQMAYSGSVTISGNGDLHIPTVFGDIIDHAPLTFYSDNSSLPIKSWFTVKGNTVGFAMENYDNTKSVTIDPWVVSPNFNSSTAAWEVETDGSGNVYVIGGETPMQLRKYDSSGNPLWTYSTPWDTASVWLGTLATDNVGNSYITSGTAPEISKVDASGSVVWTNSGNNASCEYWSITFNCDKTKLIVGGTYVASIMGFDFCSAIYDIDINNGSVLNFVTFDTVNIGGIGTFPIEVRSISSSKNAQYIFLTHTNVGAINQNIGSCPSDAPIFEQDNGHNLAYKCENYLPASQNGGGLKALVANDQYFYTHSGNQIHQRSLTDGSLINSVTLPGGVSTTDMFGDIVVENSGLAVDAAGNVYAGSGGSVIKFDANLNILAQPTVTFTVYDLSVNSNGEVVAVGAQNDNQSTTRNGKIESISISAAGQYALVCCDANICPIDTICSTDAAFNLIANTTGGTWSGTGITSSTAGTFDPSVSGVGTFPVTYTQPCGSATINVVVRACANLTVCLEDNGDVSVSGGTGPYTWEEYVAGAPTPITNQAECVACGYTWMVFQCVNGVTPVTECPGTPSWSSFGTGSTITLPAGADTIRVTDVNDNSFVVYNVTTLPDCPDCLPMNISSNSANVVCYGQSTGSITGTPPSGGASYDYLLQTGSGTTVGSLIGVTGAQTFNNLPAGTYNLTVTDTADCDTVITITITQPSAFTQNYAVQDVVCQSDNTGSINLTITGGNPPFTYTWSNGNNTSNPTGLTSGTYTVTFTDAGGCTYDSTISVGYSIAASFTADPPTGVPPLTVTFTYTGTPGISYNWNFGDGSTDTIQNPVHTYATAGTYNATLTVYVDAVSYCVVTFTVIVESPSFLIIPNVFTPDGNGYNDAFTIQNAGLETFSCTIFNRWGKLVYEWSDPTAGWDGKTTAGKLADDGVYYYIITAKGLDGVDYNYHGTVTLLK